jgi:hypothetical protein
VAHVSAQKLPQWLRNWLLEIVCKWAKGTNFPCKKAELVSASNVSAKFLTVDVAYAARRRPSALSTNLNYYSSLQRGVQHLPAAMSDADALAPPVRLYKSSDEPGWHQR